MLNNNCIKYQLNFKYLIPIHVHFKNSNCFINNTYDKTNNGIFNSKFPAYAAENIFKS